MGEIKRLMVYCSHGHDIEEDDFPDVGRYVLFTDHAAAVARLESRLALAEKVVEAAGKEPWIMRGQPGDDFEYGCEGCNYSIIEGRVHHGRDCLFGELRSALSALEAMEEA